MSLMSPALAGVLYHYCHHWNKCVEVRFKVNVVTLHGCSFLKWNELPEFPVPGGIQIESRQVSKNVLPKHFFRPWTLYLHCNHLHSSLPVQLVTSFWPESIMFILTWLRRYKMNVGLVNRCMNEIKGWTDWPLSPSNSGSQFSARIWTRFKEWNWLQKEGGGVAS